MQRLDKDLAAPAPHAESISARLPRNIDPWTVAEIRASSNGDPIYGENSCNLGQTSNFAPVVLNSRSVSSHPIPSMVGGKPSFPVASVPSNAGGKPRCDLRYPLVELLLIIGKPLL